MEPTHTILSGDLNGRYIIGGGVCSLITVLNALEMYLLWRFRNKWHNYQLILFTMSTADIMIGLCGISQMIIVFTGVWDTMPLWEAPIDYAMVGNGVISSIFAVILSADRVMAVSIPFKHRVYATKRRLVTCLIISVIAGALLTILMYHFNRSPPNVDGWLYVLRPFAIVQVILISVLYATLLIVYKRNRSKMAGVTAHHANGSAAAKMSSKSDKSVTMSCLAVVAFFVVCFVPMIVYFCLPIETQFENIRTTGDMAYYFMLLSSVVNPFIYFFPQMNRLKQKSRQFRIASRRRVPRKYGNDNALPMKPLAIDAASPSVLLRGLHDVTQNTWSTSTFTNSQ